MRIQSIILIILIIAVIFILPFAASIMIEHYFQMILPVQSEETILLTAVISIILLIVVGLVCVFLPSTYWKDEFKAIGYKYYLIIDVDLSRKENDANWIRYLDVHFETIFKENSANGSYGGRIGDGPRFIVYTNDLASCRKAIDDFLVQLNLKTKK